MKTAKAYSPRNYRALYYSTPAPRLPEYTRQGRACTLVSAVRAAITHVLLGKARYVLIENLTTGNTAAQLWCRQRGKVQIVYAEQFVPPEPH